MRILQFGFGTPTDPFLPHNYVRNCVVYTGTHDNDTVKGWYKTAPKVEQKFCLKYLNTTSAKLSAAMVRAVWSSVANVAVAPLQDLLELGPEARMNYPGKPEGNWSWRMPVDALNGDLGDDLLELNTLYSRTLSR